MRVGAHDLAVQDRRARPGTPPLLVAHQRANAFVHRVPNSLTTSLSKPMIDGLAGREALWEEPPRAAVLDEVENGIQDQPRRPGGTADSLRCWQHWFEKIPLSIRD